MIDARVTGEATADAVQRSTKDGKKTFWTVSLKAPRKGRAAGHDYVSVMVWGDCPAIFAGQQVIVSGVLSSNTWKGKDGTERWGMQLSADASMLTVGEAPVADSDLPF